MNILLLDSVDQRRQNLVNTLEFLEHTPIVPTQVTQWEAVLDGRQADCALIVATAGDEPMHEVFRAVRAYDEHLPIVLVTEKREGAVTEPDLLAGSLVRMDLPLRNSTMLRAMVQVEACLEDSRESRGDPRTSELFRAMSGTSQAIRQVSKLVKQVGGTNTAVLVLGESGTGKEVVARNIHYQSSRRFKPFVPFNCAAVSKDLLESELFGHEKEAFAGALGPRIGRFEMANGGTLFLDDIGDMPKDVQVKLLRVLQDGAIERIGSSKVVGVDVRIVAATHIGLERSVKEGRFLEELFYRLNVSAIEVPPLRDRAGDLPMLINDLVSRMEREGRPPVRLTPAAIDSLGRYDWPGNVRELSNLVERLAILYPNGVVDEQDLPEKYQVDDDLQNLGSEQTSGSPGVVVTKQILPPEGLDLKEHLNAMERNLIGQALEESDGVVAHAARRLRVRRTTLVEKMRKHGLGKG